MSYIPNTDSDKKEMLEEIGITSGGVEELLKSIPSKLRAESFDLSMMRFVN